MKLSIKLSDCMMDLKGWWTVRDTLFNHFIQYTTEECSLGQSICLRMSCFSKEQLNEHTNTYVRLEINIASSRT